MLIQYVFGGFLSKLVGLGFMENFPLVCVCVCVCFFLICGFVCFSGLLLCLFPNKISGFISLFLGFMGLIY